MVTSQSNVSAIVMVNESLSVDVIKLTAISFASTTFAEIFAS